MSNISYMQAGVSTIPFISPFINCYNIVTIHKEMRTNRLSQNVDPDVTDLSVTVARLAANLGKEDIIDNLTSSLVNLNNQVKDCERRLLKKRRFYSLCSLIGSALTIAIFVAMYAAKLFMGDLLAALVIPYTVDTLFTLYRIYSDTLSLNKRTISTV